MSEFTAVKSCSCQEKWGFLASQDRALILILNQFKSTVLKKLLFPWEGPAVAMKVSVVWRSISQQCPYQHTRRVYRTLHCQLPDKTFYHTTFFLETCIYKTDRKENKLALFPSVCIRDLCAPGKSSVSSPLVLVRLSYRLELSWLLLFLLKL